VVESTRKKLCEEIASICLMVNQTPELRDDLYSWGWINGVKDAYNLEWKDICGECVGCQTPICMPKGGKHG